MVALIQAKPGKTTALKRALTAMVAATRTEAGCLNYDLHQDTEDTRNFIFHENWTSEAHLSAHLDSPHLHAFRAQADELLAEPPKLWRASSRHTAPRSSVVERLAEPARLKDRRSAELAELVRG